MFTCKMLGLKITDADLQKMRFDTEKDFLLEVASEIIRENNLQREFNIRLSQRLEERPDLTNATFPQTKDS